MKSPIVIDSKIEFVILGPLEDTAGIVIRSKNLSMRLIAFAKYIYENMDSGITKRITEHFDVKSSRVVRLWSDDPSPNKKNELYMFCTIPTAYFASDALSLRELKELQLFKVFRKFVQDVKEPLYTFSGLLPEDKQQKKYTPETLSNFMAWHISFLLSFLE